MANHLGTCVIHQWLEEDKDGALAINKEDEIVAACLMTEAGQVVKK